MINKLLKIVFIFSLFLLILSLNFKLYALNFNYYKKEFIKLNIYDKIPNADKNALNLINYFNNKENLNNFYDQQAKLHLQDVKYLINLAFIIFYISLIFSLILLIYFIYKKQYLIILDSFLISGITTLLIVILISFLNFDSFFTTFHKIFFTNNLWLFNPEDNLVNLFPQKFFYDITLKIIINSSITSLIFIILSLILKRLNKSFLNQNI